MSFGSSGFGGFGQNKPAQPTGFGGFGTSSTTTPGKQVSCPLPPNKTLFQETTNISPSLRIFWPDRLRSRQHYGHRRNVWVHDWYHRLWSQHWRIRSEYWQRLWCRETRVWCHLDCRWKSLWCVHGYGWWHRRLWWRRLRFDHHPSLDIVWCNWRRIAIRCQQTHWWLRLDHDACRRHVVVWQFWRWCVWIYKCWWLRGEQSGHWYQYRRCSGNGAGAVHRDGRERSESTAKQQLLPEYPFHGAIHKMVCR